MNKLILLLSLISIGSQAQEIQVKAIFLSRAEELLEDPEGVSKFVSYMDRHDMNTVLFYGPSEKNQNARNSSALLKQKIDSASFGAFTWIDVTSNTESIINGDSISNPYQASFYEYEWWRKLRGFNYYKRQLFKLDLKPVAKPTWLYVGWFSRRPIRSRQQAYRVVDKADVLCVHVYQKTPSLDYVEERLKLIAEAAKFKEKKQKIVFLFSAEPKYSSKYLIVNSYEDAYWKFVNQLDESEELKPLLEHLDIQGFAIFSYNRRHH